MLYLCVVMRKNQLIILTLIVCCANAVLAQDKKEYFGFKGLLIGE